MEKHLHLRQGWAVRAATHEHHPSEEELPLKLENIPRQNQRAKPKILAGQPGTENLAETRSWYALALIRLSRFSCILASVSLPTMISIPDPSFWDWRPTTTSQEAAVSEHKPIREDGYEVTLRPHPSANFASALDLVLSLVVADDLKRLEEGGLS